MSVTLGSVDNVLFVQWQEPQVIDMNRVVWEAQRVRAASKKPLVVIAIVPEKMPVPPAEVRAAMAAALPRILDACAMNILVIEGQGLKHSLVRSAAAAMMMMSPERVKSFPVHSVEEALIRARVHLPASPDEVVERARGLGLLAS